MSKTTTKPSVKGKAEQAKVTKRPVERLRPRKGVETDITAELKLAKAPKGTGGVRFDGDTLKGIYVPQRNWVDAGRPETITVEVRF